MRACILGGGPSGLFTSEYLAKSGFDVDLFERNSTLLGNYKYARMPRTIPTDPRVRVHLNSDEKTMQDCNCDFYVLATGAEQKELKIPGSEYALRALDLVKEYYGDCKRPSSTPFLKKGIEVCIIGMGNVALDLAYYLRRNVKKVTLLSRSSLGTAAFDNHVLRELADSFDVEAHGDLGGAGARRLQLVQGRGGVGECIRRMFRRRPRLDLVFGAEVARLEKKAGGVEISYKVQGRPSSGLYDSVVASVGFLPNVPVLDTEKPVYHTGWCQTPRGNIGTAQEDARMVVEEILRDFS